MKPLATFIMRGYSQAALVAAVSALLSLLFPLFGLISSASVGLVTLRRGGAAGALLTLFATLAVGVFALLALGSAWPAVGILVVFWIPVLGLAVVLRRTRSLDLALQVAGLAGLVLVLTLHLALGDPAVYWQQVLEPMRQALTDDGLVQSASGQALFAEIARWMTGAFGAALLLQLLVSLFIARGWQAALYNPGGFGEEFRSFRMGRASGALILVLLLVALSGLGGGLAYTLLPVPAILLLLQGLAVLHRVHRLMGAHWGWLFGLYLLLVLFMPQLGSLVVCIGLVDIWADIRSRVERAAVKSR